MINFLRMMKATILGLFHRRDFDSSDDFWFWYRSQVPDKRYYNESLEEAWGTFFWMITFGSLRADIADKWNKKHGRHYPGFSDVFQKEGYFFKSRGIWLFVPNDGSFIYGVPGYEEVRKAVGTY